MRKTNKSAFALEHMCDHLQQAGRIAGLGASGNDPWWGAELVVGLLDDHLRKDLGVLRAAARAGRGA